MFKEPMIPIESKKEKGEDVKIKLMFIRHGERTTKGELTDYGRKMTGEIAEISPLTEEEFDAIKAIGSPAGPKSHVAGSAIGNMSRATETAHIFGDKVAELSGSTSFETRNKSALSYETLKNKMPYNHTEVYNSFLPENFTSLSDEDKAKAAAKAQTGVVDHLMALDTPEALAYKQEVAGAYAYTISHYEKMAKKLNSESSVLMPAGVHSPMMEIFLQKALIRKNEKGENIVGFKDIKEIGGEFNPSEAYTVIIETDQEGNLKPLELEFAGENRPHEKMHLDPEIIKELSEHYKKLHKESE